MPRSSLDEECVRVRIGAFSFEMPVSLTENFEVLRSPTQCIRFVDGEREFDLNLTPLQSSLFPPYDFGEDPKPPSPQLYRECASVNSDEFSYSMSLDELRWHKYLVSFRQLMPQMSDIEFCDSATISGNLLNFHPGYNFEWSSKDDKWHGAMTFVDRRDAANIDWIRHVCATFELTGDPPDDVENLHEDTIKAMIEIVE